MTEWTPRFYSSCSTASTVPWRVHKQTHSVSASAGQEYILIKSIAMGINFGHNYMYDVPQSDGDFAFILTIRLVPQLISRKMVTLSLCLLPVFLVPLSTENC